MDHERDYNPYFVFHVLEQSSHCACIVRTTFATLDKDKNIPSAARWMT